MAPARTLKLIAGVALLIVACGGPAPTTSSPATSAAPTASVDIKRTKLDLAYTAMSTLDLHNVSSKKILEGAVAALNAEIKKTGGNEEIGKIDFQDVRESVLSDFKKFAEAAAAVKARNPQITADRYADVGIEGMITTSPDCHTYYVDKNGGVHRSRPQPSTGSGPRIPTTGTSLGGPDEAGLTGRLLPGGIAYITFRAFVLTGTYKIADEFRKMLDKGVAAGAKAWLIDLRGNGGGSDPDYLANYFLVGNAPMLKVVDRTGPGGVTSARGEFTLPAAYQLPIAIVQNDRSGSAPEVFAADLRENNRATIVGAASTGCVGSTDITKMADGSRLAVVAQELVGANTGFKYNNVGVPPDVPADDASAVDKAIAVLLAKL
jgi:hypothetical protein